MRQGTDGAYFLENLDGYSLAEGGEQFANATAEEKEANKAKLKEAQAEAKKAGYFSKERRSDRKDARVVKKTERIKRRTAKKGAVPLKKIGQRFKNILRPVKKNADGSGTKPDGTNVPASNMGSINLKPPFPPLGFDKMELGGKAVEVLTDGGKQVLATDIPVNETTVAVDSNGIEGTYKLEDTIPSPSPLPAAEGGMSKQTKIIIGVSAGLLVLGIIGIVIYKRK